ncbi:hypothetical protein F2P81_009890 [Scophthalmus maximus]|uniref:Uncharacterized protein n=1 Tax=Scophthalmus maximus TaxID=52904 RepID=A0A6A4SPH5_SCOMX|nr:hypothetical protein F2P81_009890 [Scophthalmus maximus]
MCLMNDPLFERFSQTGLQLRHNINFGGSTQQLVSDCSTRQTAAKSCDRNPAQWATSQRLNPFKVPGDKRMALHKVDGTWVFKSYIPSSVNAHFCKSGRMYLYMEKLEIKFQERFAEFSSSHNICPKTPVSYTDIKFKEK